MFRQAQHRDAVALDGFDRHQMVGVDPVRHAEQRAAGMRRWPASRQRRPGGIAQRQVQRLGIAGRSPMPRHARRSDARSALRRSALPAPRARRRRRSRTDRDISSPPGAARTAACRRGSGRAHGSRAPAPAFPPRCRTVRRRSRRDAGRAPRPVRSRPSRPARPAPRAPPADARAARRPPPPACSQERAVQPHQPVARRQGRRS